MLFFYNIKIITFCVSNHNKVILSLVVSRVSYFQEKSTHKYELLAAIMAALCIIYGGLQCAGTMFVSKKSEAQRRLERRKRQQKARAHAIN